MSPDCSSRATSQLPPHFGRMSPERAAGGRKTQAHFQRLGARLPRRPGDPPIVLEPSPAEVVLPDSAPQPRARLNRVRCGLPRSGSGLRLALATLDADLARASKKARVRLCRREPGGTVKLEYKCEDCPGPDQPHRRDFSGNATKIIDFSQQARSAGATLILFPELAVCGYPPRDLVERPSFVARNRATVEMIAAKPRALP